MKTLSTEELGKSYGGREVVIERKSDGHFYADAMVNGQLVRFLVDTGATGVALTAKDARHVGIFFSPGEFTVVGKGASGAALENLNLVMGKDKAFGLDI